MTAPADAPGGDPPSRFLDRANQLLARGPQHPEPRGARGRGTAWVRSRLIQALRLQLGHQRDVDAALADAITQLSDRVRDGELAEAERDRQARERTAELSAEVHAALTDVDRALRAQVRAALQTKSYLAGAAFSQFDSSVGSVIGFTSFTPPAASDLNEINREPVDLARDLLTQYVTLLAGHSPVVDLACGAGELLSELAATGIQAQGVESDPGLAAQCRARDLTVRAGDALGFLEAQPAHSLGAVFSSGVLERLSARSHWRLLEHALRALRPGGMLIAETLNPHSISAMRMLAAAELDQHPVFPEVALGMSGLSGFARAFVFAPGHPNFETARFTAPRYALVATAPDPPANGDGV